MADNTGAQKYNLAGMMVGNGATDWDFDVSPSFPEAAHAFNIVPKKLLDEYNRLNCTIYFNDFKPRDGPIPACNDTWNKMEELAQNLNWYDLMRNHKFTPDNNNLMSDSPDRIRTTMINGKNKTYKLGYTFSEMFAWHKNHPGVKMGKKYAEKVLAKDLTAYMNDADVRTNLHI